LVVVVANVMVSVPTSGLGWLAPPIPAPTISAAIATAHHQC
jgi:hypothetical protein